MSALLLSSLVRLRQLVCRPLSVGAFVSLLSLSLVCLSIFDPGFLCVALVVLEPTLHHHHRAAFIFLVVGD